MRLSLPCSFLGVSLLFLSQSLVAVDAAEADIVIVGGGTAGCVLASRLCQGLPDLSITLIERSAPRSQRDEQTYRTPRLWGAATNLYETITTTEQVPVFVGKTLGGTSGMFTNLFIKPKDFSILDDWGIEGLDAASGEAFMDKAVQQLNFPIEDPGAPNFRQAYADNILAAAENAGIAVVDSTIQCPVVDDQLHILAPMQTSFGVRVDASSGYIAPLKLGADDSLCPNLTIVQEATVSKIIFEGNDADAVEYVDSNGMVSNITVHKEVILSAGTHYSPVILQRSGVGPYDVINDIGVPVVSIAPTGRGMKSRPVGFSAGAYGAALESVIPGNGENFPIEDSNVAANLFIDENMTPNPDSLQQFAGGQGGVYAKNVISITGVLAGGTIEIGFASPDISTLDMPIISMVCHPKTPYSNGRVAAFNTDPARTPTISYNWFADWDEAGEIAAEIVQCLQKHQAILGAGANVGFPMVSANPEGIPGSWTDEQLISLFLNILAPANELLLSNSFDDHASNAKAVDGSLKVHGVTGVRVVDASTVREVPAGSRPMSLVYMLAEAASDMIIKEYDGVPSGPGDDDDDDDTSSAFSSMMSIGCATVVAVAALFM